MERKGEKFILEELTAFIPMVENIPFEIGDKVIEDIKREIEGKINSGRIRLNTKDCSDFFNIVIDYRGKTVVWKNPDNKFIFGRFLIYSKKLIASTTSQTINIARQSVSCLGQVTDDSPENKNKNIEYVNNLCKQFGISFSESSQTEPTAPKPKKVKTEQQKDAEQDAKRKAVEAHDTGKGKTVRETSAVSQKPAPTPTQEQKYEAVQQTDTDKTLLPLQSISVMDCMEIEPKRYMVDGLIEAGTITQYAGKEKGGKSYTLMHMALSMSAGLPWLGRKTMSDVQGGILWLNLDMSRSLGKRRVNEIANGIEESFDKRTPDLFSNFHLMDSQTFNEANRDGLQFFTDNNAIEGLKEYIISNNIKCCFIDNLIQVEGNAQENVSNDMRTVLNRMKTLRDNTDCSFIFIHHTDKAGNRGRGSSDIFAETDLNLQLEADTKDSHLLKLITDGARSTASQDIGMLQEWVQRIDDNGQPMTDANGHPVFIYRLSEKDASLITTSKDERKVSKKTDKTIADNIEKIKDVFRSNGNKPLTKNAIIKYGELKGTKDTQLESIRRAESDGVLKSDTGLLYQMDNDIL